MGYFIFLCACNILVPIIMFVFGIIFSKHPPKEISGICGYRTTRSMRNIDTWRFANIYAGKLWIRIGAYTFVPSLLASLAAYGLGESGQSLVSLVIVTIQVIVIIASIRPVENALKKNFDETGKRRMTTEEQKKQQDEKEIENK